MDLGAVHVVGRLVWWPTTVSEETPPVTVATSADGLGWEAVGTLASRRPAFVAGGRPSFRPRNGWLEVRFAPRRLRYLRLARLSGEAPTPWGVAELYLYEDAGGRPADVGLEGPAVAAALEARGLRRLLADPVISARVARATRGGIRTLFANGFVDSHGRYLPLARLAERIRLRPGDGALVPEEEMEDLRARLGAEGLGFREEPLGDHRLVYAFDPVVPPMPCRRTTWAVSAVVPDGEGRARYTVQARLRDVERLVGLRVEHPEISTREVPVPGLQVSEDGRAWRPVAGVRRLAAWGWAGRTLFRFSGAAEELLVPPTPARELRLDLRLPYRGERAIASVCARGSPLA